MESATQTLMKIYKWLSGLLLLTLICSAIWVNRGLAISAPDDIFTTITGKKIALKALRGKPVIVAFWATDCPGCIKEIPHLIDLYQQYHKQGLEMIAVAMYYDPPSHVVEMSKTDGLPYDIALDLQAEHARAFGDVQLIPRTFLIAPDGSIDLQITGTFDLAEMKTRIENFIKG